MTTILDPTDERVPVTRQISPRPAQIAGTVALLDISKPRGNVLLDRLEALLSERLPGIVVKRYAKPTFTKPAPEALRRKIFEESDFVVEGLAD
jgi:hypothetical protein